MKKILRFLVLFFVLVSTSPQLHATNDTLTVANGTATSYAPIYYEIFGYGPQQCQMIYPASMLSDLQGRSITAMAFYMNSPSPSSWNINVTVRVAIVNESTLSAINTTANFVQVWQGAVTGQNSIQWFNFSEPITYSSGNLLVEVSATASNSYNASGSFVGITQNGASYISYNLFGYDLGQVDDFLPKASFVYNNDAACFQPADLAVNLEQFIATVTWNPGADETNWLMKLNDSVIGNVTSPAVLYDLSPATDYTVAVQSLCSNGDTSIATMTTFSTPCLNTVAPYTEGFEGYTSYALPNCWLVHSSYDSYGLVTPCIYAQESHSGNNSLAFSSFMADNFIVTPTVNLGAANMHVSFWGFMRYGSGVFEAGYLTDRNDTSTFVPRITLTNTGNEWQHYEFYTDTVTVDTIYIAFRSTMEEMFIDDLVIDEAEGCRLPENLSIDTTTDHSASLSWTMSNNAAGYEIAYSTENNIETAQTITGIPSAGLAMTIGGLNSNTTYYFWIRSLCDDDTTNWQFIDWTRTTCSDGMSVPVVEDFTHIASDVPPACWTLVQNYTSNEHTYPYVSNNSLYFYCLNSDTNLIAMPYINLPANQMEVTIEAYTVFNNRCNFTYGYMTDLSDPYSFVPLGNVTNTSAAEIEFNTSSVTTSTDSIWIAFRATTLTSNHSTGSAYLTRVEVRRHSSCERPSYLAVDTFTHDAISLHWNNTGADGYELCWNDNSVVYTSDTSITLQGLAPRTTYYLQVRSICTNDTSYWRQAENPVTTVCGEESCQLTVEMFDNFGDGWTGNAIKFFVNGMIVKTATLDYGSDTTVTIHVCEGDTVDLIWQGGSFPEDASFTVLHSGITLMSGVGSNYFTGDLITTLHGCPSCTPPTGLTVTDFSSDSINISWTPADNEYDNEWIVSLNGIPVGSPTSPNYTLHNLTPNTEYTIGVATHCSGEDTSVYVTTQAFTDCANGNCELIFALHDRYGDGWGNAGIYAYHSGIQQFITLPNGSDATETIHLCNGENITLIWNQGGLYDDDCSFIVSATDGHEVTRVDWANMLNHGDTIFSGPSECRSCVKTDSIMVTNISSSSMTFSWTATGEESEWTLRIVNPYGTIVDTNHLTTPTFTATGLTPSDTLWVNVKAFCSPTDSSWLSDTFKFVVPCSPTELPWYDDFSNLPLEYVYYKLPPCWSIMERSDDTPILTYYNNIYLSATTYSNTPDSAHAMASTPFLAAPANGLYVRFHASTNNGQSNNALFQAGIVTNPYDPETFVPLMQLDNSSSNREYEFRTNSLNITDTACVAFRTSNYETGTEISSTYYDIYVEAINSCPFPDSIEVVEVTEHTATLSWPAVGNAYKVYLNDYLFATVYDTVFTVTGLQDHSDYIIRIRTLCDNGDLSVPVSVFISTTCEDIHLPYYEYFLGVASEQTPHCWTTPITATDSQNRVFPCAYLTNDCHSTPYGLAMHAHSGAQSMASSQRLIGNMGNINVSFWVEGYGNIGFVAGLLTDPDDVSTFIPMLTVNQILNQHDFQYSFRTDTMAEALTDTVFHFAIKAFSNNNYGGRFYVDDINIVEIPECSSSFDYLNVPYLTDSTATIEWQTSLGHNENAIYTVQLFDTNSNLLNSITTTQQTETLTGLSIMTNYRVVVTLNCGGTVSTVSDTVDFIIYCNGTSLLEVSSPTSSADQVCLPMWHDYRHSMSQQIYKAHELNDTAASFRSVKFNYDYPYPLTGNEFNIEIYLCNYPDSTITQWVLPANMQLVYSGPFPAHQGWNEFVFSSPFYYDGESNLLLAVKADGPNFLSSDFRFKVHQAWNNCALYYHNDMFSWVPTSSRNSTSYRNDVRFITCISDCNSPTDLTITTIEFNSATLSWNGPADNYEIAIRSDSTQWSAPINVENTTSYTFTGLSPDTYYQVRVRSLCDEANAFLSHWTETSFVTDTVSCIAPDQLDTVSTELNSVTLNWNEEYVTSSSWLIHVWNTDFDQYYMVNDKPATVTGLSSNVLYNAEVIGLCFNGDTSSPSNTIQFTTRTCKPVTNLSVSNITDHSAIVSWSGVAQSFIVEYGPQGFVAGEGIISEVNTTAEILSDLEPNTAYSVTVRTRCNDSSLSARVSVDFQTNSTQGIDNADDFNVFLYPNPTSGLTTIALSGINEEVDISLIDINGRTVLQLHPTFDAESLSSNNSKIEIDVSGLSSGAYFVRINTNHGTCYKKLIVE